MMDLVRKLFAKCPQTRQTPRPRIIPQLEGLEARVTPSLTLVPTASSRIDPFSGVASLKVTWNDLGIGYGTGAFIDATHILTAAHVVYDVKSWDNGHFADDITVMVGRNGSDETSYDSRVYKATVMSVDPLANNVVGNHDIAVITLDPNGGYPAHYNFGFINNGDQVDYSSLPLHSIGYPGDNYFMPSLQVGRMYQTAGYATGINYTTDWYNHSPVLYWHNHTDTDASGLSLFIRGQSGSPIFWQDAQGHYDIVGVQSGGDKITGSDGDYHVLPNGEGDATPLTAQEANLIQTVLHGTASQHSASLVKSAAASKTNMYTITPSVVSGVAVQFNISVSGSGSVAPSGSVSIYDGATLLSSANLQALFGVAYANFTTSALTVGSHAIIVVYGGDSNFLGSSSAIVTEIVRTPTPTVFTVGTDGSLWQDSTGTNRTLLSPAGTILSVSAATSSAGADVVFAITSDHHLWEHAPTGWLYVSAGSFQQISAATNQIGAPVVFGVLTNNSLWEFSSLFPADHWSMLSPGGTVLSVSAITDASSNDDVYAITSDSHLWEHTPAGWTFLSPGLFLQVSAGLNGAGQAEVFAVPTDHSLWVCNPAVGGDGWRSVDSAGTILSVSAAGHDEVFAVCSDSHLWKHTATGWTLLSSGSFTSLGARPTAAGADAVFAVLTDASLWEYAGVQWSRLHDGIASCGVA